MSAHSARPDDIDDQARDQHGDQQRRLREQVRKPPCKEGFFQEYTVKPYGAPGRTRTGTTLRSADFKSAAYTISPPGQSAQV
jgi:hypothetical protein